MHIFTTLFAPSLSDWPPASFMHHVRRAGTRLWLCYQRHLQRLDLARLDKRMLDDIGLTETDRRRECAPFWLYRD
ncbi:MAG: hypothetical protein RIB97_07460 [Nitratireductor sp.]